MVLRHGRIGLAFGTAAGTGLRRSRCRGRGRMACTASGLRTVRLRNDAERGSPRSAEPPAGARDDLRDALMRLLDSRVVARAARLVGLAAPHVVPGSDLTARLLAQHITAGERITIVGLQPEWLPALASRCGIAPPAHHNPPHGFAGDP